MRAGIITAPYSAEVQEVETPVISLGLEHTYRTQQAQMNAPAIRNGYALVAIKACGICTWEQRVYRGTKPTYPFHGGHEMTGVIEQIVDSDSTDLEVGDLVAVARLARCGHCDLCRRGLDNLCQVDRRNEECKPKSHQGPGGFADYVVSPIYQLVRLNAESVSSQEATFTEPVSCVIRSIHRAKLSIGDTIGVFGAGTMGLLHLTVAKAIGLRVVAIDSSAQNRKKALSLGADYTLDANSEGIIQEMDWLTSRQGVDAVFVVRGRERELRLAVKCVRRGGSIVVFASYSPPLVAVLDINSIHSKEVTLVGTTGQSLADFAEAAKLISNRNVNVQSLVSEVYDLDRFSDALRKAILPDTNRVVVVP